jgi:hypothetical protein
MLESDKLETMDANRSTHRGSSLSMVLGPSMDERLACSFRLHCGLVLRLLLLEELILVDNVFGEVLASRCHGALVRRDDGGGVASPRW